MADKMIFSEPERPDYEPELIRLIQSDLPEDALREQLGHYHDNDISNVLSSLLPAERKRLYRVLGVDAVSDIFAYLEEDVGIYLAELDSEKAADIIENMDADDAVDVLEELEDDQSSELIRLIDAETRHDITLIRSYNERELGSLMTTNFVAIRNDYTVKQAMRSLVEQAADNDNISTIYVTNESGVFCGAINLPDLIVARQNDELKSLITTSFPYVYATETVDDCLEQLKDYSEDSIPVLDNDKHLLGIITAQDIVEVVDEQMSEDYARFAGLTEEEELNEPLKASIKKRIPWLITLLFLGLFVSTIAGMFEQVVSQLTLIVSFQSLILGMAGNVGTQSLAVTIRVLVDEELERGQRLKLVLKELRIGFVNGLLLGSLAFALIGLYIYLVKSRSPMFSFAISGCIGLSLLVAMIISSLMGTVIPLFFHKLKVDPAVASGPLISTINDLIAVITYYGLAWVLLLQVMHLA